MTQGVTGPPRRTVDVVWICPACGSNNLLDTCWSCCAPQPTADTAVARPAEPPASPAPRPGPAPAWNPLAIPPQRRSPARLAAAVGLFAVAAGAAVVVGLGHMATGVLSPSVALAAPPSIGGLPRVTGQDPAAASLGALHLVDVVSATYGSGDVRYTVVAISTAAALGDRASVIQAVGPQVTGDAGLDEASRTSVDRDGATITCWRMTGAVAGVTCSWSAGGVTGTVVQVGSADIGRAVDFTVSARRGLERH